MKCPECGTEMIMGATGAAIACAPGLRSVRMTLPPSPPRCPSRECQQRKDDQAIERAIKAGIIDP